MARPTSNIDWGVGNPDFNNRVVEPSAAKKQQAWLDGERPPAPIMNWLFYNTDLWVKYLEESITNLRGPFDYVVGSGPDATYATIQDAINDPTLGTGITLFIQDSANISAPIQCTKDDWLFLFDYGVVYTDAGAATCFEVQARGCQFNRGRFVGFNTVFDLESQAEYTQIIETRFSSTVAIEVDDSKVAVDKLPVIAATITEV